MRDEFLQQGFLTFPAEAAVSRWAAAARPAAAAAARDPAQAHWLRCGGTWFVGVDALPNDAEGRVGGGPPLAGAAMDFIRGELGLSLPLHRAQVSVCYPGYPKPSPEESEAAFGFRLKRDAAHVDGLLAEGPEKRRCLKEPHAYVLGLALTEQSADAAPLTVWEGSHLLDARRCSQDSRGPCAGGLARHRPHRRLQEARRTVFATCRRITLPPPGRGRAAAPPSGPWRGTLGRGRRGIGGWPDDRLFQAGVSDARRDWLSAP